MICYTFNIVLNISKNLYKYSFHLKSWIVFISYIKVSKEFNKINEILQRIVQNLSSGEVRRLSLINIFVTILWFVLIISDIIMYSWLRWNDAFEVVMDSIWAVFGFGWISLTVFHLTHICFAIFLIELKLLRQANIWIKSGDNHIKDTILDINELNDKFFSLQKLKQSIDDNLGLLPFLWFLELFASMCLRLTQIAWQDSSDPNNIYIIIEYLFEFILLSIVYFTYLIGLNYFQTHRPTKNELIIWLNNYDKLRMRSKAVQIIEANENDYQLARNLLAQHLIHCYSSYAYRAWKCVSNRYEIYI